MRVLYRLASLAGAAALLTNCSQYSKVKTLPISAITVTAEQKALAGSLGSLSKKPIQRLGHLLDAANSARAELRARPSDSLALSDYNFAVSRIVELIQEESLTPWSAPVIAPAAGGEAWSMRLTPPDPRPEFHPSKFLILPSDRFEFTGKLVGTRMIKQGLGAPIVVQGDDLDLSRVDEFVQGKHIFYGLTAVLRFNGKKCELVYLDPLKFEDVSLDGRSYPLRADFQAPLALGLAETDPKKDELKGLFKPDTLGDTAQLSRLEPYNPNKIPILCIHGLGNSQATWMPMIEFLRNDAAIRKNYQFWFFSYPSGISYPIATAILRRKLDQFTERYPNHKDIVVIGHSMGGMISRLLITDSGMTLWDTGFNTRPEAMAVHEETRKALTDTLIFDARNDISRVIFASASHRGSDHATNFFGKLGAKLIGKAVASDLINKEALANLRPELNTKKRDHLPNSVDVLNPESPFLKVVNTLPLKSGIPFHSIIGDRGKGGNLDRTKPQSKDGIVPYWSSHLEGAESELIIPSGHWSNLHPLGMAEVKRILMLHVSSR
jgi:hypothetical protein